MYRNTQLDTNVAGVNEYIFYYNRILFIREVFQMFLLH